jgi:hypothetical protein
MNKVIAAYNLCLPPDMINHICSYVFCTMDESIAQQKEKYKPVFKQIQSMQRQTMVMQTIMNDIDYYHSRVYLYYDKKTLRMNRNGEYGKYLHSEYRKIN